jgi:hypothetical protein
MLRDYIDHVLRDYVDSRRAVRTLLRRCGSFVAGEMLFQVAASRGVLVHERDCSRLDFDCIPHPTEIEEDVRQRVEYQWIEGS